MNHVGPALQVIIICFLEMLRVHGRAAVIAASSCFSTPLGNRLRMFREVDLAWCFGAWLKMPSVARIRQGQVSHGWLLLILLDWEIFVPVPDVCALCPQTQKIGLVFTVCLDKDLHLARQRDINFTFTIYRSKPSKGNNWNQRKHMLFC